MIKPEKAKSSLKFLKSQGMSGSQDQKKPPLVWRQFFSDKNSPQRKLASATIANPVYLMNGTTKNTTRLLN